MLITSNTDFESFENQDFLLKKENKSWLGGGCNDNE